MIVLILVGVVIGDLSCMFWINPMGKAQEVNSISITPGGYDPQQLNTTIGSTVTWTNNDPHNHHSVTSNAGIFDSTDIGAGGIFSYTFNNAGSFPYHSNIDADHMNGIINVG